MAFAADLLKRASKVYDNLRGTTAAPILGQDGDIIFSKNNVCVHQPGTEIGCVTHAPGYLAISCQRCETLGLTLVLQWLPNSTLHSNPRSIRTISPMRTSTRRRNSSEENRNKENSSGGDDAKARRSVTKPDSLPDRARPQITNSDGKNSGACDSNPVPSIELHSTEPAVASNRPQILPLGTNDGDAVPNINVIPHTPINPDARRFSDYIVDLNDYKLSIGDENDEPELDDIEEQHHPDDEIHGNNNNHNNNNNNNNITSTVAVPDINVIPHSPIDPNARRFSDYIVERKPAKPRVTSSSSEDEGADTRTPVDDNDDDQEDIPLSDNVNSMTISVLLLKRHANLWATTPEEFASSHNMLLADSVNESVSPTTQQHQSRRVNDDATPQSLFSVDLGKMRLLRVFYSDVPECTSGQLVIASHESQYKILHFHHGGLDRVAAIFEQWHAMRSTMMNPESPISAPDMRDFCLGDPSKSEINKNELDPEEGLYEAVAPEFWRASVSARGVVHDHRLIRKAIYFAGLEPSLRREVWPFLLGVYPWHSTHEQRETIRNDLFIAYQQLKRKRVYESSAHHLHEVESAIDKDVVRTDRKNPYFSGDDNPNITTMKDILLNYAVYCPPIGYMQGMSDLLAPILSTIRDEADTFWCFVGVLNRAVFVTASEAHSDIDSTLNCLRDLLRLLCPAFFAYLEGIGDCSLELLFTHRWILLLFKRELPEKDVLPLWEASWAAYRTPYLHLFVAVAIIDIYGADCVKHKFSHDELLFYFSSLALHMDAGRIMKKARGLLFQFSRLERIPCTLAHVTRVACDGTSDWQSHGQSSQPIIDCIDTQSDSHQCAAKTKKSSKAS